MKKWVIFFCFLVLYLPGSLVIAQTREQLSRVTPIVSLRLQPTPYEMGRPATWVEGPVTGPQLLASWVHPKAQLYPNLNVTLEPVPASGEGGVEALFGQLAVSLPDFKADNAQWTEINGIRGHRSTSQWSSIFGDLRALRFLIPYQGRAVVITFVDHAANFPKNELLFSLCLNALAPFEEVKADPPPH